MADKHEYFTVAEREAMIRAVAHGQKEFIEEDVFKLYGWALKIRIDNAVLNLILKGEISVDTTGKELIFKNIDWWKIEEKDAK